MFDLLKHWQQAAAQSTNAYFHKRKQAELPVIINGRPNVDGQLKTAESSYIPLSFLGWLQGYITTASCRIAILPVVIQNNLPTPSVNCKALKGSIYFHAFVSLVYICLSLHII
jgi:hypothetical protein